MAMRIFSKSRVAFANLTSVHRVIGMQKRGLGSGSATTEESSTDEPSTSTTVWPDPNLGFLGPPDRRLPLPGNVGLGNQLHVQLKEIQQRAAIKPLCDVLTIQLPHERHVAVLSQIINPKETSKVLEEFELPSFGEILECFAHDCPQLIRKDFTDLFPGLDIMLGYFTVITLSQRAINDISSDEEVVNIEREELLLYFVLAAEEICSQLKELGYWADFIDPSSGRPYLLPYTSASIFETDERYRQLGFLIEDVGRCKVVTHYACGPHVFVGCLFTNAPVSCRHVKQVIEKYNRRKTQSHRSFNILPPLNDT